MGVTNVCAMFTPCPSPPARGIVACVVIFVLSALVFVGLPQDVPRYALVFIMWQAIGHMSLVLLRYYRVAIFSGVARKRTTQPMNTTNGDNISNASVVPSNTTASKEGRGTGRKLSSGLSMLFTHGASNTTGPE